MYSSLYCTYFSRFTTGCPSLKAVCLLRFLLPPAHLLSFQKWAHTPFSSQVLENLSSGRDGGGPRRVLVLFWKHPTRSLCVTCLLVPPGATVLASWYYHLWPNHVRMTTGPQFPRAFLVSALRSYTQQNPLVPDTRAGSPQQRFTLTSVSYGTSASWGQKPQDLT